MEWWRPYNYSNQCPYLKAHTYLKYAITLPVIESTCATTYLKYVNTSQYKLCLQVDNLYLRWLPLTCMAPARMV